MIRKIFLDGHTYPIRTITFPNVGLVNISITKLNDIIMDESGGYTSLEAENIDNQIFYYVLEEELGLEINNLIKVILKSI